jgi:fatty-acyl-CoA synthase
MEDWYEYSVRTWGKVLDETTSKFGEREAIVYKDERVTYKELQNKVLQLANGLLKLNIKKGDHIAIWMSNCVEWVISQFAIYNIGGVMIPINTRYKITELEYVLKQSDTSTLIMRDNFLGKIDSIGMLKSLIPELDSCKPGELESGKFPLLKNIICLSETDNTYNGIFSFNEIFESGKDYKEAQIKRIQDSVSPDDVCQIMYTSGTTGFPKGAMIAHRNNLANFPMIAKDSLITEKDRLLSAAPFFSNFGCMGNTGMAVLSGACQIVMETFDPKLALELMEKEKVTFWLGIPTMYISVLEHPDFNKYDLSSFKGGMLGGAPVPVELIKGAKEKMGATVILNGYGLVEGSGVSTMCKPGDSIEHMTKTVGKPLPTCELKIADTETGETLPPGKQGEICTRDTKPGSHVMKGYYKMPEETKRTIDKDGWLHSGDLGVMDEEGYVHITGRLKEMFLTGGFNVYPAEIENFLHTHPKIKQAYVIGVPDHRLGEVCMVYIELKEGETATEEEIIEFCKGKIANIKIPRYVKFTREFPMTALGKIQKFKLREMAIKELGLEKEASIETA